MGAPERIIFMESIRLPLSGADADGIRQVFLPW